MDSITPKSKKQKYQLCRSECLISASPIGDLWTAQPPSCQWSYPVFLRIRGRSCSLSSATSNSTCSTRPRSTVLLLLPSTAAVTNRAPPSLSPTTPQGLSLVLTRPRTTPRAERASMTRRLSFIASRIGKTNHWGCRVSPDSVLSQMKAPVQIMVLWCSCIMTSRQYSPIQAQSLTFRLQQCMEMTWHWLSLRCIELKVCELSLYFHMGMLFQHGGYRVFFCLFCFSHAALGDLLVKPWRNMQWTAECVELFGFSSPSLSPSFCFCHAVDSTVIC